MLSVLLIGFSLGLIAFSAYLMQLDQQIRVRFSGARWALPAQVYAAPMELYAGLRLSPTELTHELNRLGYREDPRLANTGSFQPSRTQIDIHVRPFDFWDEKQAGQKLGVRFEGNSISAVYRLDDGVLQDIVRLDPMLIGSIFPRHGEDRVLVRIDEVPDLLVQGLVAVEDRQFFRHHGVSPRAIFRAALANLRAGHVVQGGSTITQQLVKNFFLSSRQTLIRKIDEAFMALLIERHYSKREILEAYFNEVHLGQDGNRAVHGFGLGAHFYYNKPLSELEPQEIAMLVGLIKGPSYYNPRRNPERALARRDLVLDIFHSEGLIDDAAYQRARVQSLGVDSGRRGGAERFPAFVELVKRQLREQYQEEDLTDDGLRIFTTLNPRAQEALERRISEALPTLERSRKLKAGTLESAGVVVAPEGGEVLALVSGREVRFAGFNRALDARRPIGSLVKPFVYLTALQQPDQFNLNSLIPDEPLVINQAGAKPWAPKNYDRKLHGAQPLYKALAQSYNLPVVHVGMQLGASRVMETLKRAGYRGNAAAVPSIFLGALEMAPIDVAQMYATLAAGGFRAPLSAIREVQTKEGQPLKRFPIKVEQTLPESAVYLVDWAMRKVMSEGTGRAAYATIAGNVLLAGKSGTTDDYRDSWFAGFAADHAAVIWVGRDDNQSSGLTGSSGALPIWTQVMNDLRVQSFDPLPPPTIEEVLLDRATGLRADGGCPAAQMIPVMRDHVPQRWAPCALESTDSAPGWLRDLFGWP